MRVYGGVPFLGVTWISVHCKSATSSLFITKAANVFRLTHLRRPTVLGESTGNDSGVDI